MINCNSLIFSLCTVNICQTVNNLMLLIHNKTCQFGSCWCDGMLLWLCWNHCSLQPSKTQHDSTVNTSQCKNYWYRTCRESLSLLEKRVFDSVALSNGKWKWWALKFIAPVWRAQCTTFIPVCHTSTPSLPVRAGRHDGEVQTKSIKSKRRQWHHRGSHRTLQSGQLYWNQA